jgi:insulysin
MKKLLLLICCFNLTSTIHADTTLSPEYTILENLAKEAILTPSLQGRQVLKLRLNNGLEAVLISDPLAELSAAALTVKTGSWQDYKDYPGIAHFLEHMLFLGTKKYPQESGYQHFIAENGGTTNAFTTNDFTSYLFSVNNQAFDEALDRFSEFFKEPLFNPSGVARELQAIDQEYAKNVQNDQIRAMYVMKEIANDQHPYHEFGMGNSKTLSKVSQKTLVDWYDSHYSANLMRLIVYSKLPLENLKDLVVRDFSDIINKKIEPMKTPTVSINVLGSVPKMYYIEPVKTLRDLTLIWNLPEKFADVLDKQPESVVCHVFGDEGEGSLLAALKHMELAESLGCGSVKIGPGSQVFYISVDLTDEGVKQMDAVIEKIFQAIAGLKKTEIPKYLFDDVQQIAKNKYRYKNREDMFETVMNDAMKLPYEDIQTFPVNSMIPLNFDPTLIQELLGFLTPVNAGYFLLAPSTLTGVTPNSTEKWLDVKYSSKPIAKSTLEKWQKAIPSRDITVTPLNSFIPKNLSILNTTKSDEIIPVPKPEIVMDSPYAKIYFAKDTAFGAPEIYFSFEIKTPSVKSGIAESVVLADLYVKALKDALNKLSYPATVAGLHYDIQRTDNGISITIDGFNDNAELLFQEIVKQLNHVDITEEKFAIYKESLRNDYENSYKSSPLKAASDVMKSALYKDYTMESEKSEAIKNIDFQTFKKFLLPLFEKTYVEGLMYGNMNDGTASKIASHLLDLLPKNVYPKNERQEKQVVVLPENTGPYFIEKQVDVQGNAIILLIEQSLFTLKGRAAQQILMQAVSGPFFSTLRTKQQTGYIVDSTNEELEKKLFNLFVIQSNTHDPEILLARIELFIEGFNQEIGQTNLTLENFETIKKALIQNLTHSYNNPKTLGELLKNLAFKYDGDFDWMNKRIQAFHDLTYDEFLDIAKKFFAKENKQRLAILIDGVIPKDKTLNYIKLQTINQLRKLSTYSSGNCCDFYQNGVR